MTTPEQPTPVQPVIGLFSAEPELIDALTRRLTLELGELAETSSVASAPAVETADAQMFHQWLAFAGRVDPGHLAALRAHARRVEALYPGADGTGGRIRLEVAILDPLRLVRAGDGDAPQRLYLGGGVYGEIVLMRQGHMLEPLPWTPPEYLALRARDFFARLAAAGKDCAHG